MVRPDASGWSNGDTGDRAFWRWSVPWPLWQRPAPGPSSQRPVPVHGSGQRVGGRTV